MSLTHAILTSLLEKPCTGAELARRFDKSLGFFWQATHQQIYRELGKMEGAGLIQAHGLPTSRGQQRHFEVLVDGREELASWCAQEGEIRPIRDSLLVRMRAAAILGTEQDSVVVMDQLRRHSVLHEQVLRRYEAIEKRDFAAVESGAVESDPVESGQSAQSGQSRSTAEELQLAVVRAGIAYEKSWLAWCQQSLADIAQRPGP